MKETSVMNLIDDIIAEDKEIIDELIEEEIKPIIEYKKKLQKEQFEREYREVLELEGKI